MKKHHICFIAFLLMFHLCRAEGEDLRLTSECDTLSLVEGLVNAYNGKLVQLDTDITIQGSDPLTFGRTYDGGHHFSSPMGYGIGHNFPLHLEFYASREKRNVFVELRSGLKIPFTAKVVKNSNNEKSYLGIVDHRVFEKGYTNSCQSLLNGARSIRAMKVTSPLNRNNVQVHLGDGTVRHYKFWRALPGGPEEFRLVREERPNRSVRHFTYHTPAKLELSRVWTATPNNKITLNWINFDYKSDPDFVKVTASNGQSVKYYKEKKKGTSKEEGFLSQHIKTLYCDLLTKVEGSHLPKVEYEAKKSCHSKEAILSVNQIKHPQQKILKADYNHDDQVKSLSIFGEKRAIATFDYHSNHTNVQFASGAKSRFDFSNRRLVSLNEGFCRHTFLWDECGQLQQHKIVDGRELVRFEEYKYDQRGNILEKAVGDKTAKHITCYTYSDDGRNLLLTEMGPEEKETIYTYCNDSSLVLSKCIKCAGTVIDRTFFTYDLHGFVVKVQNDDGITTDPKDLTGVTSCLITEIESYLDPAKSGVGLPFRIREYAFDPKSRTKKLLKAKERFYVQGDLLRVNA